MRAKPGLMISSGISIDAMEVAEDLRQAVVHLAEHLGMVFCPPFKPPLAPKGRASACLPPSASMFTIMFVGSIWFPTCVESSLK